MNLHFLHLLDFYEKTLPKGKKMFLANHGDQHFFKTLAPKLLYCCYVPGHIRWEMM